MSIPIGLTRPKRAVQRGCGSEAQADPRRLDRPAIGWNRLPKTTEGPPLMPQDLEPRTRQRRASPRGEERRREILATAVRLFSARGYHATTIADLAAEVGITQAGLLHHFPSKRALLLAVLQERELRNSEAEETRKKSGDDFLTTFVRTLESDERDPMIVQLFGVLSAESVTEGHPAHDWFVERQRRVVENTAAALEEVIDPAKLPAGATLTTVARWIIAAADGVRLQWLLESTSFKRHEVVWQLIQALHPYLREGATLG